MNRKYSEAFVNRQVEAIDRMYETARQETVPTPAPDEFGQVKISYEGLKKLLKNRSQLSYVNGFWAGVCVEQRVKP